MKKKILIAILIIVVIGCTCFVIDYIRIKNNQTPICSFHYSYYTDGGKMGSGTYYGLGYKIIDYAIVNQDYNTNTMTTNHSYEIGTWFKKIRTNEVVNSLIRKDQILDKIADQRAEQ